MKNEKLLNAIGEIDDDLISDAIHDTKKKNNFIKWGSLAAVLLLCVSAGIFGFSIGTLNSNSRDKGIQNTNILNNGISDSEPSNPGISDTNMADKSIPDNASQENDTQGIYTVENSIVILDVNPSISFTVNNEEKIVSAEGLNEDGNAVLDGMDLTDVDMTVAVNAVIGSMLQKGYLSDMQNAILVSVENEDVGTSAALQEKVSTMIGTALQNGNLKGTVLSQTLNDTSALEQMAQDYHISLGKAALIQEIMAQDVTLSAEKLAPLSITEIALISQSKNLSPEALTQNGSASDKAYISREAALEVAYNYANVNAEDVVLLKVEFDSENGVMVYEVEFLAESSKYQCDIEARTGQIVKYESERQEGTSNPQQSSGNQQSSSNQQSSGNQQSSDGQQSSNNLPAAQYIGEEAAKEAALTYAGISADTVNYINAWLEYDDGRPEHYEVEFAVGYVQYKYEVDLYSGTILAQEMENYGYHDYDHHNTYSGQHHNEHGGFVNPASDIGEEAAKEAALSHAGFTASQVRKLKADYDYDNGIAVYKVEFEYNNYEYEYKIDAATGTILEYEIDD